VVVVSVEVVIVLFVRHVKPNEQATGYAEG